MDEQIVLSEKILNILLTLRDQSAEEIANYDIKDEWDTVGTARCTARCKAKHGEIHIPRDSSDPWIKKCCHYINCLDGDCDVALRSVVIYWLAFLKSFGKADGWRIELQKGKSEKYQLHKDGEEMLLRGDTMNSYATPVVGTEYEKDGLLRYYLINEHKNDMIKEGILTPGEHFVKKYQQFKCNNKGDKNVWSSYILDDYATFIERFEEMLKKEIPKEAVYEYIRVNDTVGNFIPVPFISGNEGEFNRPRGTGNSYDFWDLAILCIYNFYSDPKGETDKEHTLEWLLSSKKNADLCRKWLGMYETWDNFIEQNFMQDFVNQEEAHYGKPKELWMGHFKDSVIMPNDSKQYTEFFTNASALIHARSIRIALAVKNMLDGKSHKDLTSLANEMVCGYDS